MKARWPKTFLPAFQCCNSMPLTRTLVGASFALGDGKDPGQVAEPPSLPSWAFPWPRDPYTPLGEAAGDLLQMDSYNIQSKVLDLVLSPSASVTGSPVPPMETERSSEEIHPPVTNETFSLPPYQTPCQA